MEGKKKNWKFGLMLVLMLAFSMCMPVLAASDDNSLSSLNIYNGTLSRDFQYDIWEYDVTVDAGTTELLLEPTTSDPNASVTSITGTVLVDGEATVLINTVSESGIPMTYTLHVKESGEGAPVEETEAPETEPETQPVTETQTEAPQTEAESETETEAAANALQAQVAKLKTDSDLMLKIVYGLIALCVILLFFIINLILKNRDLKDDLKDAEDQLAYQTNEFARKERMMATDTYYAPTQQGAQPGQPAAADTRTVEQMPAYTPVQQSAPVVEETFGTRASAGGYQGMQPEDVPPNRPITAEPAPEPSEPVQQPQIPVSQPEPAAVQPNTMQPGAEPGKSDVDITMVEL